MKRPFLFSNGTITSVSRWLIIYSLAEGLLKVTIVMESSSGFRELVSWKYSSRYCFATGSAGGDSMVKGSMAWPLRKTLKSRCGPVDKPVLPT